MDQIPLSQPHSSVSVGPDAGKPSQISARAQSSHLASPALTTTKSLHLLWPFENAHEARLFHHYITHLAPLVQHLNRCEPVLDFADLNMQLDVCDKHHHFGRAVPKRAAHYPVLANTIFALSSRHLSLLSGSNDKESPHYVSECLQILIINLEDPLGHWDENFLAAVIILRSHEEMSGRSVRKDAA